MSASTGGISSLIDIGYYRQTVGEVSPMLKIFAVVMVVGAYVVWYLYNKSLEEKQQPTFVLGPKNARELQFVDRDQIPPTTGDAGYSLGFWFWIDDWSYKLGQVKHIIHRGDKDGKDLQPGIFLDGSLNNLRIRYDVSSTNREYTFHENKASYQPGRPVFNRFEVTNTTLRELQARCDRDVNCAGFTALIKDVNNLDSPVWGATFYNTSGNVGETVSSEFLEQLKGVTTRGYKFGTFSKARVLSNNPSDDVRAAKPQEIVIPNIPLNRWCYLVVVATDTHIEVYFNGRLYKSVILTSRIVLNDGDIYINQSGGFSGALSQVVYYNKFLTLPEINKVYLWGPDPWTWTSLYRKLNDLLTKYTFKVEAPALINLIPEDQINALCNKPKEEKKEVNLYTEVNYLGNKKSLGVGRYANYNDFGGQIFNNKVSSITIPTGLKVRAYDYTNYSGGYIELCGNVSNLGLLSFRDQNVESGIGRMVKTPTLSINSLEVIEGGC